MPQYEYRVVPAPSRGEKARGVKSTADRFALALTNAMNTLGRDGWEYLRADTLPCDERVGLTGSKQVFQHMLVFRREVVASAAAAPVPAPDLPRIGPAVVEPSGAAPTVGPAVAADPVEPAQPGLAAE